jgi:hypothetical protein
VATVRGQRHRHAVRERGLSHRTEFSVCTECDSPGAVNAPPGPGNMRGALALPRRRAMVRETGNITISSRTVRFEMTHEFLASSRVQPCIARNLYASGDKNNDPAAASRAIVPSESRSRMEFSGSGSGAMPSTTRFSYRHSPPRLRALGAILSKPSRFLDGLPAPLLEA